MKKASALLSLVSIFLLFSGCSWEMPEKVSVKTNAIYNFSFGALEKSLDEELDFKTILATDNEDVKIYDYFPQKKDTKVQQFLITMKVFEKDLNEIVQDNAVFNAFLQNCPAGISINLDSLPAGIPPLTVSGSESFDFNPTTILSSVIAVPAIKVNESLINCTISPLALCTVILQSFLFEISKVNVTFWVLVASRPITYSFFHLDDNLLDLMWQH